MNDPIVNVPTMTTIDVDELAQLRAEIAACHKLLDERGLCVGSEFHGDLLRRVEWLADANRLGPKLRVRVEEGG